MERLCFNQVRSVWRPGECSFISIFSLLGSVLGSIGGAALGEGASGGRGGRNAVGRWGGRPALDGGARV